MTSAPDDRWQTSGGLLVASSGGVISLPPKPGFGHVVLDLPGLALIEALARGGVSGRSAFPQLADKYGCAEAALGKLFDELLRRQDILRQSSTGEEGPAPAPHPLPRGESLTKGKTPSELVMVSPVMFRASKRGFEWTHHDGRVLHLSTGELYASGAFKTATSSERAFSWQKDALGAHALPSEEFRALTQGLFDIGLLTVADAIDRDWVHTTSGVPMPRFRHDHKAKILASYWPDPMGDAAGAIDGKLPVVPVNTTWTVAPAALGLLTSHAQAYEGGRLGQSFHFRGELLIDRQVLEKIANQRGIYLFSNYMWNHAENRSLSALVKRLNPRSITIHGGPDTPAYPSDNERYFQEHPHVDITVRGEGEVTLAEILAALEPHLHEPSIDLSCLGDVLGLSFRQGQAPVRTDDRPRIDDLDTIPSPILAGLFAPFAQVGSGTAIVIESNRGCPFGCTFCDWGSATLSRIRKFDLERVFSELEWCARSNVWSVVLADANFGVFERDVQIAERVATLKQHHGFPGLFGTNYAKNGTKHLSRIISVLADAGILAEGKVSLQTNDSSTLVSIRRKNIKVTSYDDLSAEFQRQGLPLSVELMMGLPGATGASFRVDLQDAIDRDVRSMVYTTVLLPNSPMNEPAYRAKYGIVAQPGQEVRQTSSYTHAEWTQMQQLTSVYLLCDFFGVLRQVATYVRSETGMREVDVYERMLCATQGNRQAWPMMTATFEITPNYMVPPAGWRPLLDEVRRFVTSELAIPEDSALETVMTVQGALLPARERTFPDHYPLAHDFARWHAMVRRQQQVARGGAWESVVPPLRSMSPATFTVTDPNNVCSDPTSGTILSRSMQAGIWELGSSIARNFVRAPRPQQAEADESRDVLVQRPTKSLRDPLSAS